MSEKTGGVCAVVNSSSSDTRHRCRTGRGNFTGSAGEVETLADRGSAYAGILSAQRFLLGQYNLAVVQRLEVARTQSP